MHPPKHLSKGSLDQNHLRSLDWVLPWTRGSVSEGKAPEPSFPGDSDVQNPLLLAEIIEDF